MLKLNLHLVLEDFGPFGKSIFHLKEASIPTDSLFGLLYLLFVEIKTLPGAKASLLFATKHTYSYV